MYFLREPSSTCILRTASSPSRTPSSTSSQPARSVAGPLRRRPLSAAAAMMSKACQRTPASRRQTRPWIVRAVLCQLKVCSQHPSGRRPRRYSTMCPPRPKLHPGVPRSGRPHRHATLRPPRPSLRRLRPSRRAGPTSRSATRHRNGAQSGTGKHRAWPSAFRCRKVVNERTIGKYTKSNNAFQSINTF